MPWSFFAVGLPHLVNESKNVNNDVEKYFLHAYGIGRTVQAR
jgi:hypothetical protein